jgi:N-acetylmuramoyl-L-alanine amidase
MLVATVAVAAAVAAGPLDGRTVVLDPGHNGRNAAHPERILRRRGAEVVLTRRNDRGIGPCIPRRARIANRAHADAAVSIHADGLTRFVAG